MRIKDFVKATHLIEKAEHEFGFCHFGVTIECLHCGKEVTFYLPLSIGSCPRIHEDERYEWSLVYCDVPALCLDCMRMIDVDIEFGKIGFGE